MPFSRQIAVPFACASPQRVSTHPAFRAFTGEKSGSLRAIRRGLSYTWLFHLHSMVKIQPFSPVFPLADFMAETLYWLFPWNFKEKSISHFLWHSPEKSHLCKQTGASRRPAENRKGPSLWRAASRSREMAAGGPHCRPYGGLCRHLRIKSISSASLKGTSVPSRTSAARARLERWSLRMDSSTVPRATSR